MPVERSLAGRTFPSTDPYVVSREKLAEFARATGSEFDGKSAPTTFAIVVAFAAMNQMIGDPEVAMSLHQVVHGEQRFRHTRPIVAGDQLTAVLTVESVRQIGGADIIGTRSEITDAEGAHVCSALATLVHRGEES